MARVKPGRLGTYSKETEPFHELCFRYGVFFQTEHDVAADVLKVRLYAPNDGREVRTRISKLDTATLRGIEVQLKMAGFGTELPPSC